MRTLNLLMILYTDRLRDRYIVEKILSHGFDIDVNITFHRDAQMRIDGYHFRVLSNSKFNGLDMKKRLGNRKTTCETPCLMCSCATGADWYIAKDAPMNYKHTTKRLAESPGSIRLPKTAVLRARRPRLRSASCQKPPLRRHRYQLIKEVKERKNQGWKLTRRP